MKASEELVKRKVILADGRYLIFYTFTSHELAADSKAELPEQPAAEGGAEEK